MITEQAEKELFYWQYGERSHQELQIFQPRKYNIWH